MNQPPGQPPFGNAPPPPPGYPQAQPGYPPQQGYSQPQQGYPQQGYTPPGAAPPPTQGYAPPPQGGYGPPQGAYGPPPQGPYAQPGSPPQPGWAPPQPGWAPPQPGWAPPAQGSWASDNPAEQSRNAALASAFAPSGNWQNISRGRGAGIFGLGVVLLIINIAMISGAGRFFIQALVFTPVALITGLYMLIVGTPMDPHTRDLAGWAKIGYGVSVAFGIFLGVIALVLVGC